MDVSDYELLRSRSQLAMGRLSRYQGTDNEEWKAAARDFAFAKLMITLAKLRQEYPDLSPAQKREVRKELSAA